MISTENKIRKMILTLMVLTGAIYIATIGVSTASWDNMPLVNKGQVITTEIELEPFSFSNVQGGGRVLVNGVESKTLTATTDNNLKDLLKEFAKRATKNKARVKISNLNENVLMANYTTDKVFVGLVAFPAASGKISYFLGESPKAPVGNMGEIGDDADPSGIPLPDDSRRAFSIHQPNEGNSYMNYYISSEDAQTLTEFYNEEMASEGWDPQEFVNETSKNISQIPMLFFKRGRQECIIGLQEQAQNTTISVLVRKLGS